MELSLNHSYYAMFVSICVCVCVRVHVRVCVRCPSVCALCFLEVKLRLAYSCSNPSSSELPYTALCKGVSAHSLCIVICVWVWMCAWLGVCVFACLSLDHVQGHVSECSCSKDWKLWSMYSIPFIASGCTIIDVTHAADFWCQTSQF